MDVNIIINKNNMGKCLTFLCIWLLGMLCSCQHYELMGEQWLPGEIEVEGVELTEEEEYPKSMYGTLSSSGGTIMLSPERDMCILSCEVENRNFIYNNPYHHYTDSDFQFELPVTDFSPTLTLGGEWFGANEWVWVEYLVDNNNEYKFVAYIDENTTGEPRIIRFCFTGRYRLRDIILTQEAE